LKDTLQPSEIANAALCPTRSQVYYLWDQFQQHEYGGRSNEEIFSLLEQKVPELKSDGVDVKYSTEPFAMAVVTPIMRRIFADKYADLYSGVPYDSHVMQSIRDELNASINNDPKTNLDCVVSVSEVTVAHALVLCYFSFNFLILLLSSFFIIR